MTFGTVEFFDGFHKTYATLLDKILEENTVTDISFCNADYKTALQELVQQKKNQVLSYAMVGESGPDHDKHFTVEVSLNGKVVGKGDGRSKKKAEQEAARAAIEALFPNEI